MQQFSTQLPSTLKAGTARRPVASQHSIKELAASANCQPQLARSNILLMHNHRRCWLWRLYSRYMLDTPAEAHSTPHCGDGMMGW
jgi:hypothetical protein